MDEIVIEILNMISEHLTDDKNGYCEFNNDYYFGRLCSSEELCELPTTKVAGF